MSNSITISHSSNIASGNPPCSIIRNNAIFMYHHIWFLSFAVQVIRNCQWNCISSKAQQSFPKSYLLYFLLSLGKLMVEIRGFMATGEIRASEASEKNSWRVWGNNFNLTLIRFKLEPYPTKLTKMQINTVKFSQKILVCSYLKINV